MRCAFDLAYEAYDAGEVPVGCVFVSNGVIVGKARNKTNESGDATRHAEVVAIDQMLKEGVDISSCELFVTVEPCIMCGAALRQLGVKAVYYGCSNDRFGGHGSIFDFHSVPYGDFPSYPVYPGIFRAQAILLLRMFYVRGKQPCTCTEKRRPIAYSRHMFRQ